MILSATVVLYNPQEDVFDNICSYGNLIDYLIVVDNSVTVNQNLKLKLQNEFQSKLFYIENNENLGIAKALNIGTSKAIDFGSAWNLTMDQDSRFINFEHYIKCLQSIQNQNNVGLLAANTTRNAITLLPDAPTFEFEERKLAITSANFVNLSFFKQVGGYEEKFFIDLVDFDFCLKLRLHKLKILYFKDVLVEHNLGEVFKRKNILSRKIKEKREHSPQRAYYIARNYLLMASKYRKLFPKEFSFLKVINIVFIHDVTKILLYEDQKFQKLRAKLMGLSHFLINKHGKYNL
jgi:rhamnosyltransferase